MKNLTLIILTSLFTSCTSLARLVEIGSNYIEIDKPVLRLKPQQQMQNKGNTLLIEISDFRDNYELPEADSNFVIQPFKSKFSVGMQGLKISYIDTISYFNESTFEEKFVIRQIEAPAKILKIE